MGADLFLESAYEPNHARWQGKLNEWVAIRDALKSAGKVKEADKAQTKVTKYFNKMYAVGYFRDSYNTYNLLWLFDLSWWTDVGALLDGDSKLSPKNAEKLLQILKAHEAAFKVNLDKLSRERGPEARTYFVEKYEELKAFLKAAIAKNESITCSI